MDKRTTGIIATIATALICGCCALFACIWGILLATETPVTGVDDTVQTFPPTFGYVLLCLSVIFILVPVVVGVLTLRKGPDEEAPPMPAAPAAPAAPAVPPTPEIPPTPAPPEAPAEPEDEEPLPPAS